MLSSTGHAVHTMAASVVSCVRGGGNVRPIRCAARKTDVWIGQRMAFMRSSSVSALVTMLGKYFNHRITS